MNRYGLIVILFLSASYSVAQSRVLPNENPDSLHLVQQGRAEYAAGNLAASERFLIAALDMLQASDQALRAATLSFLGDVYVSKEEVSKAEQAYSESLSIFRNLPDQSNTAIVMRNLGATYSLDGREADAMRILREALKLMRTIPPNTGLMAGVLNALGMTYYRQGKTSKAGEMFNQAVQMSAASGPTYETADLLTNLAVVYIDKHQFQKAEDVLTRALKMREGEVGLTHPDLTFTLMALGVLYTDLRRYPEAEDQYLRAVKILEPRKPDFDTKIAHILRQLSVTYEKAGRRPEADDALARAVVIARQNLSKHTDMATIIDDYAKILGNQGKTREAKELQTEANRARVTAGLVIKAHRPF